jgi:hypothetical protein
MSVHLGHTHMHVCVCAARVGVLCFECVLRVTDGYVIRDIRDTSVTVPRVVYALSGCTVLRDGCVTHPSRIALHMRLTHA